MKYLKAVLLLMCVISFTVINSCKKEENKPAPSRSMEISEGSAASDSWIQLIDSGKYRESWSTASELLRKSSDRNKWTEKVTGERKPLGKLITRSAASREYMTSLPGVPDGEYVVIKFRSSFEKKKNIVEIVTAVREPDGKWKGAGYAVK